MTAKAAAIMQKISNFVEFIYNYMRAERITQRTAAAAWDAAQRVYNGPLQLPALNLDKLFAGRKTITWREALASIGKAIDNANE